MTNHEHQKSEYPLPLVTADTAEAAYADMQESGHDEYLVDSFKKLLSEQPLAASLVMSYVEGSSETEGEQFAAQKAIALFHEILRKQAAADRLNNTFDK
ncbi:hypothetical protein H0X09_03630 [Candidatus Saccharibacteria bacterium]|nr:hypothetical protein [Candidatus Saccharibacteria bacterium]